MPLAYILWSKQLHSSLYLDASVNIRALLSVNRSVCLSYCVLLLLKTCSSSCCAPFRHRTPRRAARGGVRREGVRGRRTVQAWELNGADLFRARGTSHAPGMLRPPLLRRAAIGRQEALRHLCAALLLAPHSTMPWDWLALIMRQLSMSPGGKKSYFKSSHFKSHFRVAAGYVLLLEHTVNLNWMKCLLSVYCWSWFCWHYTLTAAVCFVNSSVLTSDEQLTFK